MEYVKCWREEYVIKKKITTLTIKQIPKVVDAKIRKLLEERALIFKDDKKFQSSLTENPLRLLPSQAPIRSVRITTGYKDESMAPTQKDSNETPVGYSCMGDNHHVAYYLDLNGKPQCVKISFWTAIMRKRFNLPIVITDPQSAVDRLMECPNVNIRESLASTLPYPDWKFLIKFQKNDMFILGLTDDEINNAMQEGDMSLIASHLYRVQKATFNDIVFRLHTDTSSEISKLDTNTKSVIRVSSYEALKAQNPHEIKIDVTGHIYFP